MTSAQIVYWILIDRDAGQCRLSKLPGPCCSALCRINCIICAIGESLPGGRAGLSAEELIRHVVKPGDDPNQFHAGIEAFKKFGTRFHEREGRFIFDLEENEYAKVELDALKYNDDISRGQITEIWLREVFRDTHQSVIYIDSENTKFALEGFSTHGQRYVIAPVVFLRKNGFPSIKG